MSVKTLAGKSDTIKLIKGKLDDVLTIFKVALGPTKDTGLRCLEYSICSVQQAVRDDATEELEMEQKKNT